jgi:hypothetical protein
MKEASTKMNRIFRQAFECRIEELGDSHRGGLIEEGGARGAILT